jgi:DNA-binding IclR family transcriptional regulator
MATARRCYYVERALGALELLLAAEPITCAFAADELGVDERTARCLVRALEQAGFATAAGGWPRRYRPGPRALALPRQAAVIDPARGDQPARNGRG